MVKHQNVCQNSNLFFNKSKFWSKIEIFVKNRNLCQKSKFLSKIEIYVKNRNLCQKSKFLSKIEIFVQNRNFRENPLWSKIFGISPHIYFVSYSFISSYVNVGSCKEMYRYSRRALKGSSSCKPVQFNFSYILDGSFQLRMVQAVARCGCTN